MHAEERYGAGGYHCTFLTTTVGDLLDADRPSDVGNGCYEPIQQQAPPVLNYSYGATSNHHGN